MNRLFVGNGRDVAKRHRLSFLGAVDPNAAFVERSAENAHDASMHRVIVDWALDSGWPVDEHNAGAVGATKDWIAYVSSVGHDAVLEVVCPFAVVGVLCHERGTFLDCESRQQPSEEHVQRIHSVSILSCTTY